MHFFACQVCDSAQVTLLKNPILPDGLSAFFKKRPRHRGNAVEKTVENCGKIVQKIRVKYFIFVRRKFLAEISLLFFANPYNTKIYVCQYAKFKIMG